MILLCFFLVAFITICFISYKQRRILRYMNKLHGPTGLPLIGLAHEVLCSPQELVAKAIAYSRIFKNPVSCSLLMFRFAGLFSPEDILVASSTCLEKSELFRCMSVLIGDGLITAGVERWKRSHRVICSAFNLSILSKPFLDVFNKHNEKLINQLKVEADNGIQFDLWPHIFRSSFHTITETVIGSQSGKIDEKEFEETMNAFHKATYIVSKRVYQPWLLSSIIFKLYLWLMGCPNLIPQARNLTLKILKERRRQFENRHLNGKENEISEEKSFRNLTDILLNMREKENQFTDQEINDEILTIQFAGSETTAITICFTLLQLGIRQDIQEKVYEELVEVFHNSDRQPTLEDINALNYLDQCIKETLRRYPVAPLSMRKSYKDIILKNGELIPAGVNIVLAFSLLHLSKDLYDNPETWNPENFDPEKVASRPQGHFVPFGAGPRSCIGNKYAMIAIKAQLSTILRNFKVSTTVKEKDIILSLDILVRSSNGYHVKLELRK